MTSALDKMIPALDDEDRIKTLDVEMMILLGEDINNKNQPSSHFTQKMKIKTEREACSDNIICEDIKDQSEE